MQLAVHGAFDGWSRLKWIADLLPLIAGIAQDAIEHQLCLAERHGYRRILEFALLLAGHPRAAAPQGWHAPALAYVAQRLQTPHPRTLGVRRRLQHAWLSRQYMAAMLDNAAVKRSVMHCSLLMPADFDRLALPDALTPAMPYLARAHRAVRSL